MSVDPIKVLLVEDNAGDARLLQEFLRETGKAHFELLHVTRLTEALSALKGGSFGVILLDLSLPDAQGLATIGRLRGQSPVPPIVVLTGLDDEEVAVKAVEQGAQDYLIKGQVDGYLLARSLRYAIQRHRAEESLKARNRELLILRKISETILGSLDLRSVLEKILEEAMVSGSFDLGNIRLLDPSREMLKVAASRGYRNPDNVLRHRALARTTESGQSRFGDRVFKEPCIEESVQESRGFRTLRQEGVESFIEVPVRASGEVLGIIQLASRTARKFRPEEVNLLETIGNQIGVAVQKAQLYEQTKRQALELEEANRLQADFSAMIAHDLRSPLANIIAVTEMLKEGLFGATNDDQRKWLGRMQNNAHNLIDLVSDFLDVSKLEAGRIDLSKETIDIKVLIDRVVGNYLAVAKEKRIELRARLDASLPSLAADPRRLDQVLSNLLSNALKFTNEGGIIEVGARLPNDAEVELCVKDTGVGIPKNEIGSLFEKYRQATSGKSSEHKGTGLGLVICKMIVEGHGGSIRIESVEGKGSTFYFTIPIKSRSGAPSLTPA